MGNIGEELSSKYLENIGYKIIERNFRCKQGEIDIIAKDGEEYVFVEVKTRSNLCFGKPREAVDEYKKNHICKTVKYYIHKNNIENEYMRFDVIEIYISKNKYKLSHLKNVDIKGWFKKRNIVKYGIEGKKMNVLEETKLIMKKY